MGCYTIIIAFFAIVIAFFAIIIALLAIVIALFLSNMLSLTSKFGVFCLTEYTKVTPTSRQLSVSCHTVSMSI